MSAGEPTDISNENDVEKAFAKAIKLFGKVNIMINSAGIVGPTNTKITDYPVDEYGRAWEVVSNHQCLLGECPVLDVNENIPLHLVMVCQKVKRRSCLWPVHCSCVRTWVIPE
ncbi:MAG: SDR family oxidoreductase [Daejeonella sp.]